MPPDHNGPLLCFVAIAVAAVALATIAVTAARGQAPHEHGATVPNWYEQACCNNQDCHPVADNEVEFFTDEDGPAARYAGLVFPQKIWKASQDEWYHACHTHGGYDEEEGVDREPEPLCFYVRVGV